MCMCVCDHIVCDLFVRKRELLFLLKGERVVILAGLAVSHQVAGLLTQPEQGLSICSADGSMVPATVNNEKKGGEWRRNKTSGQNKQKIV